MGRGQGARERHARDSCIREEGVTELRTVARQVLQHSGRYTGLQHELDCPVADDRCLLGGLRKHRVTGCEGGSDLTREDCERKVPGADAHEDAARHVTQLVGLAGRPREPRRLGKEPFRLGGVISQEVHRLTDFREAIGDRPAPFGDAEHCELCAMGFEGVCRRP